MEVCPLLWGYNLITTFFPTTDASSISVFPYLDSLADTELDKAETNWSPVDVIVGFPFKTQDSEVEMLPVIEHWILYPALVRVCCLFVGQIKG